MNQGHPTDSGLSASAAPQAHAGLQPEQAHSATAMPSESAPSRLALLQQAFLLEQLATEGAGSKAIGELNRRITAAAQRELNLSAKLATSVRKELAERGYLEATKTGQKVSYALTAAGRTYLAGLERPALSTRSKQPAPVDEATISDEVREAQKSYLLLQLLNADGERLTRGQANRIRERLRNSLGLRPAVANYRRAKLAENGFLSIIPTRNSEEYSLTPDGLEYLAAGARHLEHAEFTVKGKALNSLVAAARESSFERDGLTAQTSVERSMPSQSELAEVVLANFQELRRERHSHTGLVPIHEVRQRIAERFGLAAARHDVLDEVLLNLWRQQRLGLEAISDLNDATEQQLNDGIQGTSGTLFYLEAPREPVASESV
jgi:predicted transcriptional regulator